MIHLSEYPVHCALIWPAALTSTYHVISQIKLLYIIADSEGGFNVFFFFLLHFYYG